MNYYIVLRNSKVFRVQRENDRKSPSRLIKRKFISLFLFRIAKAYKFVRGKWSESMRKNFYLLVGERYGFARFRFFFGRRKTGTRLTAIGGSARSTLIKSPSARHTISKSMLRESSRFDDSVTQSFLLPLLRERKRVEERGFTSTISIEKQKKKR